MRLGIHSAALNCLAASAALSEIQAAATVLVGFLVVAILARWLGVTDRNVSRGSRFEVLLTRLSDELDLDPFVLSELRDFAELRFAAAPETCVVDLRAFDQFVSHCLSQFDDPKTQGSLCLELTRLRTLIQRPDPRHALHSTRDLNVGTRLELRAVHPDFEDVYEVEPLFVDVKWLNVAHIGGVVDLSEGKVGFTERQKVWIRFQQDQRSYLFQARIVQIEGSELQLEHSQFLIVEKRTSPRYRVKVPAKIEWNEQSLAGETDNISFGGAAITCSRLIPLDETIRVRVSLTEADSPAQLIQARIRNVSALAVTSETDEGEANTESVRLHCQFVFSDPDEKHNHVESVTNYIKNHAVTVTQ